MIIGILISIILVISGVSGFLFYKFRKDLKKKNTIITSKKKEVLKVKKEVSRYEALCDHRVGLWSKSITSSGWLGGAKMYDIEVIILDQCEGRSKIKILEVIMRGRRWASMEKDVWKDKDGQWVDSSEIKELSNSRILTREKRLSKLLNNETEQ